MLNRRQYQDINLGMIAFLVGLGMQRPTLWKVNMEPKNEGLEDDVPFHKGDV